ncbi:MAG: DUF5723 family protein [Actinomycetota bacterium]
MKRKILTLLLLLSSAAATYGQNSQALYFMNLPQRTTLNPALKPSGRFYLGLPGISDISVRIDNNFLSFSDLFAGGVISDSTMTFLERGPWLDDFLAGLGNNNSVEPKVGVRLFGLAFTVNDNLRFSLDLTERANANVVFPGDILRLGIGGNEDFIGKSLDFSSLRTDLTYYHEIGIGASGNITDKLRVGGRALILSGVASGYLRNNGATLTVNDDFTHTIDADMAFNFSAPLTFITEDDGTIHGAEFDESRFDGAHNVISYLAGMSNPGFGIDLGAEYRFNDLLAVSAALTDFGFIRWKRDLTQLSIDATFDFNGLTMQDVYDESLDFEELLNWTFDSLQQVMELKEAPEPYITYLPATLTAGFSYTPVKFFTAGLLSQTRFVGRQAHQAVTFSGNLNFGNAFSTTVAYTIANRRYDNLGFGLAFRGGFTQFFVLVDNVPVKWTRVTSGEGTFRMPEHWNTVHARIGLNLVFGNREREEVLPVM